MNTSSLTPPGHLQQARAALEEAGIPLAAGTKALTLAAHFYHRTPQVSQTDALSRERNRIQNELETVSSQLLMERHKTHRLEQELAAARELPKTHQNKAYKLRKLLRAILSVLEHAQAKETTKLKSIAKLVTRALAGDDNPEQEALG
jgi:predicted nuclease with TOPRIM domain